MVSWVQWNLGDVRRKRRVGEATCEIERREAMEIGEKTQGIGYLDCV